jgi:N-acyl-D-aspartate/D-glutamate deacylase
MLSVLILCACFILAPAFADSVLFKGATVVDGTGKRAFVADVLVKGARIERVGKVEKAPAGARIVDSTGKVLAPGFIDMHSHLDFQLVKQPLAGNVLAQGVTTVVAGNCGFSLAPQGKRASTLTAYLAVLGVEGKHLHFPRLADYFQALERRGISPNVVMLAAHGMVREAAMKDPEGKPTAGELAAMKRILKGAMEDGAWGMSTGLAYPPGRGSDTTEIVELMKVAGAYNGIYCTHIRDEGKGVLGAIREAIEIGEGARVPVEISHVKSISSTGISVEEVLAIMKEARDKGLDVTGDVYPYNASSTSLSAIMLPPWVFQKGDMVQAMKNLRNPSERKKTKRYMEKRMLDYVPKRGITKLLPDSTYLSIVKWFMGKSNVLVGVYGHPEYDGMSFNQIMKKRGYKGDVIDFGLDLLAETGHDVAVISFMMSEKDVRTALLSPFVMIGSDGMGVVKGGQHPRSFGTFPRVYARYVRKEGLLTLEQAVNKMTGMPAARLGISDRGVIREGAYADLVLFDPEDMRDRATFSRPKRGPEGVLFVLVNGKTTIEMGRHTGARGGVILKRANGKKLAVL